VRATTESTAKVSMTMLARISKCCWRVARSFRVRRTRRSAVQATIFLACSAAATSAASGHLGLCEGRKHKIEFVYIFEKRGNRRCAPEEKPDGRERNRRTS
jgi:hypothetical protein